MAARAERDQHWMRQALRRAERARGRTAPNPLVGSVVVKGDTALAYGHHRKLGDLHAEALALHRAGAHARGATLYVTLEPCSHQGRQPPCIEAVLAARPRRVVIGLRDPDPRTAGRSLRRLRRAGIEVQVGVLEAECRAQNEGYLSRVERGRPFTTLKLAASLDGRIATARGESRWITGPEARAWVHRLRARCDAVCVGSETALADDPELTARRGEQTLRAPLRVVVDSRLRLPSDAKLLAAGGGGALLLTVRGAPAARARRLRDAGARIVELPARDRHVDLRAGWRALAREGVNDVLVEGGGGLAAALLSRKLVDRVLFFAAPLLIGGDGRPVLASLGVERLASAPRLEPIRIQRVGADWLLVAEPRD